MIYALLSIKTVHEKSELTHNINDHFRVKTAKSSAWKYWYHLLTSSIYIKNVCKTYKLYRNITHSLILHIYHISFKFDVQRTMHNDIFL